MPREIIKICTGQAGVQLADAAWELYIAEHEIDRTGSLNYVSEKHRNPDLYDEDISALQSFFAETSSGQLVPRTIMFDLEPTVIDEIRVGPYRNLYSPLSLLNGLEDAAGNYARGLITGGTLYCDDVASNIRKRVEDCDCMQGFMFMCGLGGGTGSGFTNRILQKVCDDYGRQSKFMFNIFPGPSLSTCIIEPYNVVLATNNHIEDTDLNLIFDNETLYNIFKTSLKMVNPVYTDINRFLSQITSSLTCSIRFKTDLNANLDQLQTNIVPYPKLHFPVVSFAPIMTRDEGLKSSCMPQTMLQEIFTKYCRLNSSNTTDGKYMACTLQFRGNISPAKFYNCINDIKRSGQLKFVNWCPTGFKAGICPHKPVGNFKQQFFTPDYNITLVSNHSSIHEMYNNVNRKFSLLFAKRAFVHWFTGEGFEEGELTNSHYNLQTFIQDYKTMEDDSKQCVYGDYNSQKEVFSPLKSKSKESVNLENFNNHQEQTSLMGELEVNEEEEQEREEEESDVMYQD